jgi:hypothetical protein
MKRREFLGTALASGTAATRKPTGMIQSPAADAIRALRLVNTAQSAQRRTAKHYLTLSELLQHQLTTALVEKFPFVDTPLFMTTGDLIPGFRSQYYLADDRLHYTVLLDQQTTGLAFKTGEDGVIYQGSLGSHGTASVSHFEGSPIRPHAIRSADAGPVGRTLARISAYFFPTLIAQDHDMCCRVFCCGYCLSPGACDSSNCLATSLYCCNLGFLDCAWCCSNCDPTCGQCWFSC